MYFTEGRLRECERIMREKPGYDRKTANPLKRRKDGIASIVRTLTGIKENAAKSA